MLISFLLYSHASPEVLDRKVGEWAELDSLRLTDVYAFGLVMWEAARRCFAAGEPLFDLHVFLFNCIIYNALLANRTNFL